MSLLAVNWRKRLWIAYLAAGALLTAAYLWVPPLKGNGPLINLLGLSSSIAIAVGIYLHRPKARAPWIPLHRRPIPLLRWRSLYVQLPEALRRRRRVPVARRRDLLDGLSRARRGTAPARPAAKPARRPRRRHRLTDPDGRHRPAVLGLPRRAEHPSFGPDAVREGHIRRLSAGRHPAPGRGDPSRRRPRKARCRPSTSSSQASCRCSRSTRAYTYALLTDAYNHQLSYDVGWIAYYLLWGAAALHPSMRTLEEPALDSRTRLTPLRLVLLAGACLIAPGVRFYQSFGDTDRLVLIVASGRPVPPRRESYGRPGPAGAARCLARARAASAGVELVAAAGREQVNEAAISAVLALVERPTGVRLILFEGEGAVRRCLIPRRGRLDDLEDDLGLAPREVREVHAAARALQGARRGARAASPRGRAYGTAAAASVRDEGARIALADVRRSHRPRARRLSRVSGLPGIARRRGRLARRGSPPAPERGALPLARGTLERPDHRPRRAGNRDLSKPVDSARPRIPRRRDRRKRVRTPAEEGRSTTARADRRRSR